MIEIRRRGAALRAVGMGLATMVLALAVASTPAIAEPSLRLIGAGATFPAPLYLRWFRDYYRAHPEVRADYQGIGSAGGIRDLALGHVDFAGADLRMTDEQAAAVDGGVVQLPMTAGAIAFVYNLPGVDQLRLSREALVGILSGRIANWSDPLIAAANPDVELPDEKVTVVVRVGASGTSYNLTRHLSLASPELAESIGVSMSPVWPEALGKRGALVKGRGNDGVAALVQALPGAIGYVQYAYGRLTQMSMAALENKAGEIVAPTPESFAAAADAIRAEPSEEMLHDPEGDASYPIIAVSWLILRRQYEEPEKLPALVDVLEYALGPGQQDVEPLGYIRYSEPALESLRAELKRLAQP